jgi:hypothetical protein
MMNVYVLKHLMDIDEWVSQRENYSYSMGVSSYRVEFWVFNHKTSRGQHVKTVAEIDETKLESEEVCEQSEEQKLTTFSDVEQSGITVGTNA